MVQRALELSGAAESALVWPRFLAGTLGRGTERMYPFARVPTANLKAIASAVLAGTEHEGKMDVNYIWHKT